MLNLLNGGNHPWVSLLVQLGSPSLGLLLADAHNASDQAATESKHSKRYHVDENFLDFYLKFVTYRNPPIFLPIMASCLLLGVVGNCCLLFFFGRPASTIYLTRDALYLRRLALVDLLVCLLVLPYGVAFEAKLVTNNAACKCLETFRHFAIHVSHLLLATYSFELSKRNNYSESEARLNRSTKAIIPYSLLVSVPVIFLFEVGDGIDLGDVYEQQNMTLGTHVPVFSSSGVDDEVTPGTSAATVRLEDFNPRFCHKGLNLDTADPHFGTVRVLEMLQTVSTGVTLFFVLAVLVSNMARYIDSKPLLARDSIFVRGVEQGNPHLSKQLNDMSESIARKKQNRLLRVSSGSIAKQNTQRTSQTRSRASSTLDKSASQLKETSNSRYKRTSENAMRTSRIKAEELHPVSTETNANTTDMYDLSSGKAKRTSLEHIQLTPEASKEAKSFTAKSEERRSLDAFPQQADNRTSTKTSVSAESKVLTVGRTEGVEVGRREPVSLVTFICCWECVRTNRRPVRQLHRWYPGIYQSYKAHLLLLILLDILVIVTTALVYVNTEMSAVVNLIHFKSVFAFYILSLTQSDLRHATWGCCSSPPGMPSPTTPSVSPSPSAIFPSPTVVSTSQTAVSLSPTGQSPTQSPASPRLASGSTSNHSNLM